MTYGFAGHLGIARETVWGTPVAAADYFKALSESIPTDIARFDTINIHGAFNRPKDSAGIHSHAGDIVAAANARGGLGFFLAGALGINSVTEVLSGVLFTNRFTTVQADFGSLNALTPYTLEVFRDVTSAQQYAGVQFNGLELSVAPNGPLQVTARIIARSMLNIAATTPTFVNSPAEPFTFDSTSLQLPAGSGKPEIEALTIAIDNQLEGIPGLDVAGEANPVVTKIRRSGFQNVTVNGTLEFRTITEFNDFINQTEQRMVVSWFKANSFQLIVDIPQLVYTAFPVGMPGASRLTVDFTGQGQYHTGSAQSIDVQLTTTTTYPAA